MEKPCINKVILSYQREVYKGKLTLYPLRRTAVFSKSVNTDFLPVYNIPSKSYWLAYFKNYISSYEGCCHFERNSFKTQKQKTSKMCQLPNFLGIPLDCTSF